VSSDARELEGLTGADYQTCLKTLLESDRDVNVAAEKLLELG
jgi:hypothetical protein